LAPLSHFQPVIDVHALEIIAVWADLAAQAMYRTSAA